MVFVLMNEQGYQFLECNKNYKESDDSDVLMTILFSMVMVMMMVVMLRIIPKTHGKCPVLHTCTQPIHITRALAAGFLPAAPCFLWSCRLRGLFAFASLAGKAR